MDYPIVEFLIVVIDDRFFCRLFHFHFIIIKGVAIAVNNENSLTLSESH